MSARLRVADVRQTIARALKLVSTDSRVVDYINQAQERLMNEGKWVGTTARYRVCVTDSCLTWPREVLTIERWARDRLPLPVRSHWYEFLSSGPGIAKDDEGDAIDLIDRGEAVCHTDPTGGSDKVLEIYTTTNESTTTPIVFQTYDSNGRWVRTLSGSSYIDGEEVTIPSTAGTFVKATSSINAGGLVRVVKPVTNGEIWLYEYDSTNAVRIELARYAPGETIPLYRRSIIPGLVNLAQGQTCASQSVTIMAKLRHIPVVSDADFLIIGHVGALRCECQAIWKEENNNLQEAEIYHQKALQLLDRQLNSYKGDGEEQAIAVQESTVHGPAVENLI